jgi:hypothetical protein
MNRIYRCFPVSSVDYICQNLEAPSVIVLIQKLVHHQELSNNINQVEDLSHRVPNTNRIIDTEDLFGSYMLATY